MGPTLLHVCNKTSLRRFKVEVIATYGSTGPPAKGDLGQTTRVEDLWCLDCRISHPGALNPEP